MSVSKRVRFETFKRDNFTCRYCRARPPGVQLQIEHVIARSRGGPDRAENLVTSCSDCNQGKSDRHLDESDLSVTLPGIDVLFWLYNDETRQFVATYRNRLLLIWPIGRPTIRWRWSVVEFAPGSKWWNPVADGLAGTRGAALDLAELHRDEPYVRQPE